MKRADDAERAAERAKSSPLERLKKNFRQFDAEHPELLVGTFFEPGAPPMDDFDDEEIIPKPPTPPAP